MKILLVSDTYPPESIGGAGKVVYDLSRGLAIAGHTVTVLTTTSSRDVAREVADGVAIIRIPVRQSSRFVRSYLGAWNPLMRASVISTIRSVNPDIVHFHNIHQHFSYAALRWAHREGVCVFHTAHDVLSFSYTRLDHYINPNDLDCHESYNFHVPIRVLLRQAGKSFNPFRGKSIRKSLQSADVVFSVSNELGKAMSQNGIRGVRTMYNGIDADVFLASNEEIERTQQELAIVGKQVILLGGRSMVDKGTEALLGAFPGVLRYHPDAAIVFAISENRHTEHLRSIVEERGLSGSVYFPGLLPERLLSGLLCSAKIVAVPSICFDSAPLMAMQGMAAKRPIIASCFGGGREIVRDGIDGFIVNPYNAQLFAKRMNEILADSDMAHRMGDSGRARVLQNFTREIMVRRTIEEYGRCLSGNNRIK